MAEKEKKMLKDYLHEKGISVYSASKGTGIPYSTVNDLVNGKVEITNCKVSLLKRLSEYLAMTMDDLYSICSEEDLSLKNSYGCDYKINVRNKSYYVEFMYDSKPVEIELCKVNRDTTYYIDEIAEWRSEAYIRERRMEEFV